jgi:hypothetical protein
VRPGDILDLPFDKDSLAPPTGHGPGGTPDQAAQRNRIFYRLVSARVGELWSALRDVATEHVAGLERLADAYLGDRDAIEVVDREELAARLRQREVLVLDVRPQAESAAGHIPGARSVPITELHRHLRACPRTTTSSPTAVGRTACTPTTRSGS